MEKLAAQEEARKQNARGLALNREGDVEGARACFERAHNLDASEPKYLLSLANMQHKLEQAEEAAAAGGAPPGTPPGAGAGGANGGAAAKGVSPASGAAIKRRASVNHYKKALSNPALPPRMREMAQAKLSEAGAADAVDYHK